MDLIEQITCPHTPFCLSPSQGIKIEMYHQSRLKIFQILFHTISRRYMESRASVIYIQPLTHTQVVVKYSNLNTRHNNLNTRQIRNDENESQKSLQHHTTFLHRSQSYKFKVIFCSHLFPMCIKKFVTDGKSLFCHGRNDFTIHF